MQQIAASILSFASCARDSVTVSTKLTVVDAGKSFSRQVTAHLGWCSFACLRNKSRHVGLFKFAEPRHDRKTRYLSDYIAFCLLPQNIVIRHLAATSNTESRS